MSNTKKTIIAGGIIFLMFVYAHAFQNETQAQEPLVVPDETTSAEGGNNQKGREILTLLSDMERVRLDESIFSDPMFQSLRDMSIELSAEPKGRPNPFAPLGKDVILSEDFSAFATGSPRTIPFNNEIPKTGVTKNTDGTPDIIKVPIGI